MRYAMTEITVGLFVLAALIALFFIAVEVSGIGQLWVSEKGYPVELLFENVGGLKTRGKVSLAGVTIGRVESISLDPKHYTARVRVWLKESAPALPDDSEWSILTAGLLGDNYIGISPGYSQNFLQAGALVPIEQTHSSIVLEELIAKFFAHQASSTTKPQEIAQHGH